jgi:hypothetical protein
MATLIHLWAVMATVLAITACGAAQGTTSARNYSPLTYKLDEPTVRKVAAVMRAWDPAGPPARSEDPEELARVWASMGAGSEFSNKVGKEWLDEGTTKHVESVPELTAAIERAGMTPPEFVMAHLAYTNAMAALDIEAAEKFYGDDSSKERPGMKPTGVFKDNVELLRRMNKEEELPSW